jgi:hypothetical protein
MVSIIRLVEIILITIIMISKYSYQSRIKFKELDYYSPSLTSLKVDVDSDLYSNYNIMIALYVHNHAYSLSTFLATLEGLKCPNKNSKCHLWVMFDKCTDDSKDIFISWLSTTRPIFDQIIMIDTRNDAQTRIKHVSNL